MPTQKSLPALLLLILSVFFVYNPVFRFPLSVWPEPREIIAHLLIVTVLFLALSKRVGLLAAFTGAALFALYPGHASQWVIGPSNAGGIAMYVGVLVGTALAAFGFERFYAFLKTQEALIRYLFLGGTAVLVLGMGLMVRDINRIWSDEMSLRRWRAEHHPSAATLNALAKFLDKNSAAPLEVKGIYEQVLQKDPRDLNAHFALADIYQGMDKPQEVIKLYNQLLAIFPDDEEVRRRIIDGYSQALAAHPKESIYQEKREDVLAEYEQLTKRKKYSANDYFNLGFLYEQVGGFEEAMRFYRKALALDPKHEKALFNLAGRYQASGDVKTAAELYERLMRYHPRSTAAYLKMGIIYNALGDADKARYLYQKVINIDPDNAEAYFNLGYLSETAGELREALNYYEEAVENNPRHAEAYYNMGNAYAALGQYPEAIASYLKTVSINRDHQNAYVNLSILSFKAKDFQGSIRYLEEARLLGYNPPAAYLKTLEPYRKK